MPTSVELMHACRASPDIQMLLGSALLLTWSCMICSMGDFEICSNGAAEISAQSATPAVSPSHANQSEASSSPEQAASNTEEEAAGRESCSTDDDQFSDVGEAADTEVITDDGGTACTACLQTSYVSL